MTKLRHAQKNMERVPGVEPGALVWKTRALPLCYARMVRIAGIEPAQPTWHAGTLPL